ncbi:2-succinyl-5-enolpyruvyl-6-hydroxy-3-cyclohexene-1-carboxylic-acid synthase [Corynebacterium aquilae]|uniref:2-succinyl-5-enolpyruvyl-6-hydroxy-3-cyclohexene-1-carboxylate synthase n=1 Tax=Corynebacterium aquilae DSM 44791 TaxID=1431546 RepID=A0A1L7CDM9_9CORY|nr:2-succinyl-5-enolpyruvyl-6-hydroxy-3-cyclohexene-1-carboxylic-acid synthase [Corynebacterium aquilae]APT83970.1 2-succinyl-5-enolpyruvyl-6-hydroxy-3-cyclohexene-1-carboxylate synthase [Corynebacterium aquilae DSM 44791]
MTSTPQQPTSVLRAITVVNELLRAGTTDVFLCPGSRNAPLSLALAAASGITLHTRLDERSASFAALGMARVQHRHVAIVMTSGTAVANAMPAMIEAHYADIPLVVISADRPARLHGTGASQTIEQAQLFHGYAHEITIDATADIDATAAATAAALAAAPRVHLNIEFDEPLVGTELPTAADYTANTPPRHAPRRWDTDHGTTTIDLSENTLVIAGDGAFDVPGLEDVPTIAEPSAPAPYRPIHPLAAAFFTKESISAEGYVVNTKPRRIIIVGHPTLHRSVLTLITDPDIDIVVLSRSAEITRPEGRDVTVASRLTVTGEIDKQWLKICEAASGLGAGSVRDTLEDDAYGFTGLHAAAAVADTLGDGDTLLIGASNPVRDMSLVGLPFSGVATHTPRGAAGIDGTVSQAFGIALATQQLHPGELRAPRTIALLGDVTFLHDIGGLLTPTNSPRPNNLTIVVANDNGGGIFETLEVGADPLREHFEQCFGTPHNTTIAALCDAYGITHHKAENLRELIDALIDTTDIGDGITVIEAVVTRDTRRALHQALAQKVH